MIDKSAEEKVLEAIFAYPTKGLSFREIERITGISIATVSKYARTLEEKNLIKLDERSNAIYVCGNFENEAFRQLKRVSNLQRIYESGLISALKKTYRPEAVILFGSYGSGEDIGRSDIDIAIIDGRNSGFDCKSFEKNLARKISLHKLTLERADSEFIGSLANGIVLAGHFSYGLSKVYRKRKGSTQKRGSSSGRRSLQKR